MGIVLAVFAILSLVDLVVACKSTDPAIMQWLPVIEPASVMVLLIAPALIYYLVWRRMKALERASDVVRTQSSRPVVLSTWKKDRVKEKDVFFFELDTEEHYGCRAASFVIVTASEAQTALRDCCEQSWQTKSAIGGVIKAFVDEYSGLPVALQTIDALDWVNLTIHEVRDDDKEKFLKTVANC